MNTRVDYGQLAAKLDYEALNKKLEQLSQREAPKKRKTVVDALEPLRERLLALHRKGWSSGQLVEELKAAGIPVSPARMRECLGRWTGGGNGSAKSHASRRKGRASAPRAGQRAAGGSRVSSQSNQRRCWRRPGWTQICGNCERIHAEAMKTELPKKARRPVPSVRLARLAGVLPVTRLLRRWAQTAPACPWLRAAGTIRPALLATDGSSRQTLGCFHAHQMAAHSRRQHS